MTCLLLCVSSSSLLFLSLAISEQSHVVFFQELDTFSTPILFFEKAQDICYGFQITITQTIIELENEPSPLPARKVVPHTIQFLFVCLVFYRLLGK